MISFPVSGISWTRVRVPRLLSTIFLVVYGLTAVVGGAAGLLGQPSLYVAPTMLSRVSWLLLILSYILSLTSSWAAGELHIDTDTVTVGSRKGAARKIRRREIVGALIVERPLGEGQVSTVEIELEDGDRVTVRLHDARQARALVEALGYGHRGARRRVRLATPTRRLIHVVVAGVAWVLSGLIWLIWFPSGWLDSDYEPWFVGSNATLTALWSLAIYLLVRRALRPPEVVLGDEGATVTRGFRRRFFVPNDSRLGPALSGLLLDRPRVLAVLRAEAERGSVAAVNAERFADFERAGRPLEGWRSELRRKMDAASYRSSTTTVDVAAVVLRSPLATPEQRVGAALALRIAGEPPARIRVAVAGSLDDEVRQALEAVASDDDPAVERAMRRLR